MKYIVYYRVSTKKQGESGLGLDAQRAMIHYYLTEEQIQEEYTEIISGKVQPTERPILKEVLELCKTNGYGLAVAKVDRLSRITEDALHVYSFMDAMLYACDIPMKPGSPMDKFTLTIYMAIADRERELISIRTKAALRQIKLQEKAGVKRYGKDGKLKKPIGNPNALTQADRVRGAEAMKAKAARNENNQRAIEFIKILRNSGQSLQQIADMLNAQKFQTARGKAFSKTQVKRLYEKSIA